MKRKAPKKLLSVLLALMLVLATLPFGSASTTFAAASDTEIENLHTAITGYLTKMSGSVLYTNNKAAYDAYINAYKIYDAAKYGTNQVSSAQATSATTTLNNAVAAMQTWTGYSVTSPSFSYGNAVPAEYAESIVWASTPGYGFGGYEKEGFIYKWTMPQYVVAFYDGHNIKIPMMLAANNNGGLWGNDRYALGFYPNTDTQDNQADSEYFNLIGVWNGHYEISKSGGPTSASDWNWSQAWGHAVADNIPGYNYETATTTGKENAAAKMKTNNKNKWWEYGNVLQYKKDTAPDKGFTNGLQTAKYSFNGISMRDTSVWSSSGQDWHYYFSTSNSTKGGKWGGVFYIIDGRGITDAVSNARSLVNFNYSAPVYNQDGSIRRPESVDYYYLNHELDDLLTKMDAMQTVSLSGITSSNYSTKAASIANEIQTKKNALNTEVAKGQPTDTAVGYQDLRNKMFMTDSNDAEKGNAREVYDAGNTNDLDATLPKYWTQATWTPFSNAYSSAENIFDSLVSGSYSAGSTASSTATTVNDTYLALAALANFNSIDAAIQAVQAKAGERKGTSYRYKKSDVDALVAKLNNATTYPYLHKTVAQRVTYAKASSQAAIDAEAATIAALADTDLDLDSQIDISALQASVENAKAIVNSADPDAFVGIDEAKAALAAYNSGTYVTNVSVPGTVTVDAATPEVCVYSQEQLDAEIAPFVQLQTRNYDVTIDGEYVGTYPYGSTQHFDSPTGEAIDWEYSMVSATSSDKVKSSSIVGKDAIDLVIMGTTTLTTKKATTSDTIKITFKSSLGKVYDVKYVAPNSLVNPLAEGHPNYAGYTFRNYNMDAFEATEDTIVVANYDPNGAESYSIGFVNSRGNNKFTNPSAAKMITVDFNTRMQFSEEIFANELIENEDEETGEYTTALGFYLGGEFAPDDIKEIQHPDLATLPDSVSDSTENWEGLYAISMVPEAKFTEWRSNNSAQTGRNYAVVVDKDTGEKTYNTEACPNTERLLAVGDNLDHVYRAQENCYLVFYTKAQLTDAIKANVFENIDTDANVNKLAATYAYSKSTRITDASNGEMNKIAFRGTTTVVPTGAQFIETGFIFSYKKNATAAERSTVQNAALNINNVGNDYVTRVKISDSKLTRRFGNEKLGIAGNTGYQFALHFATKASKYPAGTTLDIKYRTYVNYKIGGQLYTAYSEEITPSTFTF